MCVCVCVIKKHRTGKIALDTLQGPVCEYMFVEKPFAALLCFFLPLFASVCEGDSI